MKLTIHKSQQLGHDPTLHLSVSLLPLGCDGIQLINEDDGWRVLVGLLECLTQVRLGLTGQFGHDLRSVDQEEEGT